jgi:DNA-binding GntR family transcriptional regulator
VKSAEFPYVAVAAKLRARIETGEWPSGAQLPTVSQLCEEYKVSRATIARALTVLESDRLITRVARWGTFVTPPEER